MIDEDKVIPVGFPKAGNRSSSPVKNALNERIAFSIEIIVDFHSHLFDSPVSWNASLGGLLDRLFDVVAASPVKYRRRPRNIRLFIIQGFIAVDCVFDRMQRAIKKNRAEDSSL
ncbi:MAG: hypothetical protein MN733_11970 [Nitrososphaera sp.]|nr:hypothetical protein [Nitrososphaera sp.]